MLKNRYNIFLKIFYILELVFILTFASFSVASATAGVPNIISYQGRLTDGTGVLLGGIGTNYYFKFSIWDNATVGSGTKLWPTLPGTPSTTTLTVTNGVFDVNIGDTGNGYPDTLTYNFQDNDTVYLQVEVSSNNSTFETLGPRGRITSSSATINAKTLGGIDSSLYALLDSPAFTGTVNSHDIIPFTNDTYSLGSISKVWKDLFVGAGSIYVNGQEVLHTDPNNSVIVSANDTQNLVLQTTGGANVELNPASGGGLILLKSNVLLTAGKTIRTSDLSAINFSDGTNSGNIGIAGNVISSTNTNGGISITPNGLGSTYVTNGNFGVGTTSGLSKVSINGGLHVGGDSDAGDNNILADGTITATGVISGSNLSGTNTGDNATNTQYSGLVTSKQDALNGIGFVKASGTSITYDNSTYLTSFTELDPVYSAWNKSTGISITKSQVSDFPTTLSSFTNDLGNYGGFLTSAGTSAGTYNNVTVNTSGLVTSGSNVAYLTSVPAGYLQNNVGIAGGTTVVGDTAVLGNLTLSSTSNATKGLINFGTSSNYNEATNLLTLGTTSAGGNMILNSNDGAEMFTSFLRTNWTLTSGWDATNGGDININKTGAGTTTATLNTVAPTIGTLYKIVIVNTYSGGVIAYRFGGVLGTSLAATQTYTDYIVATATTGLVFTPVTEARGSITSISIIPLNQNGNLTVNGTLSVINNNITTTSPIGFSLVNNTPSNAVNTTRRSPSLFLSGNIWKSTSLVSAPSSMWLEVVPIVNVDSPITEANLSLTGFDGKKAVFATFTNRSTYSLLLSQGLQAGNFLLSSQTALNLTSRDGLVAATTTAALVGQDQISPRIRLSGTAWNTGGTPATNTSNWIMENLSTRGNPPTSLLRFGYDLNASGYSYVAGMAQNGFLGLGMSTTPTNILSLDGQVARTIWMERNTVANTAGNNLTDQAGGATVGATDKAGGDLILSSGIATGTGSSALHFYTSTAQLSTNTTDNPPTEKMTILGNGNVGISNTAPGFFLHVGSSATTTGTTVARFENAGGTCDVVPSTAGGITCSSDMNLKKNINTLDGIIWTETQLGTASITTLDKVLALVPVTYNWNVEQDTDAKHTGFIAQDVQQLFPDLVSTDPTTHLLSLNYSGMMPYTIKAIQEMNIKVKDLSSLDISSATSLGSLIKQFLADQANGIADLYTKTIHSSDQICINSTCIDEAQLKQILINENINITAPVAPAPLELTPDPIIVPPATDPVVPPVDPVVTPPDPVVPPADPVVIPSDPVN